MLDFRNIDEDELTRRILNLNNNAHVELNNKIRDLKKLENNIHNLSCLNIPNAVIREYNDVIKREVGFQIKEKGTKAENARKDEHLSGKDDDLKGEKIMKKVCKKEIDKKLKRGLAKSKFGTDLKKEQCRSKYEKILENLPQIEGVSYDSAFNCFRSKVPEKYSEFSNEACFSVKRYSLKNAWLKAVYHQYDNIAISIFDLKQTKTKSNTCNTVGSNTNGVKSIENSITKSTCNKVELRSEDLIDLSSIKENWLNRISQSACKDVTKSIDIRKKWLNMIESEKKGKGVDTEIGKAHLSLSSINIHENESTNMNKAEINLVRSEVDTSKKISKIYLNNIKNIKKYMLKGLDIENYSEKSYEALLTSTRGKSKQALSLEDQNDPKSIAESLKPWHQSIFWIPSISRWRTLYYDENSVRHTKTFTPAVFGGVREAYYAAVEFRNMIDNMDELTLPTIRRKWIKSVYPTNALNGFKSRGNCKISKEDLNVPDSEPGNPRINLHLTSQTQLGDVGEKDGNMEKMEGKLDDKKYDLEFLSGLNDKGLCIPIPIDWKCDDLT